jgi:hypothetical protein
MHRRRLARRATAVALLALAAALRYRFVVDLNPPSAHLYSDMLAFVQRAQNVLDGHFVPRDTLFPPGEHLLLALSGFLFDGYDTLVVWTHLAAGVLTCYWMWRASEPYLGRTGALTVLLASAVHFPFIGLAGFYLSETVFTAVLALLVYLCATRQFPWQPGTAFAIGLTVAFGSLWKGTHAFFLPILAAWSIGWALHRSAAARPQSWRRVRRAWFFILLGVALVLSAQTCYFHQYYGRWLPIAAEGGAVFALGKCPGARIIEKSGAQYESPRTYYTGETGVQVWDAHFEDQGFFWRAGLRCIREHPAQLLGGRREVYYLFAGNRLWPLNVRTFGDFNWLYQRLFTIALVPGMVMGLLLVGRRPFAPRVVPFLLVPSLLVTAVFFMGELRFRIPFDVVLLPLAVLGWTTALGRLAGPGRRALVAGTLALAWLSILGIPVLVRLWD